MKRVYWKFINDTNKKIGEVIIDEEESTEVEQEKKFKFILKRYKNNKHEEWLKIKNYYNGHENGQIETSISNIDKDIRNFERYGVAFDGFSYASLALFIRHNYLELEINEENENDVILTSQVFNNIVQMLSEAIGEYYDSTEESSVELYDIPIDEFNNIIEDSEYNRYKLSDIRNKLKEEKYIKCGQGRTSRLARINKGKNPVRVISFFKEKLKKSILDTNDKNN